MNVEFAIRVIDVHQIPLFDSKETRKPLGNHNFQKLPLYLRDAARAFDQLIPACFKRNEKRQLTIQLLYGPLQ